eukprot:1143309-Prymnesium_polylepis.1
MGRHSAHDPVTCIPGQRRRWQSCRKRLREGHRGGWPRFEYPVGGAPHGWPRNGCGVSAQRRGAVLGAKRPQVRVLSGRDAPRG